jgi:hypothetical protein
MTSMLTDDTCIFSKGSLQAAEDYLHAHAERVHVSMMWSA